MCVQAFDGCVSSHDYFTWLREFCLHVCLISRRESDQASQWSSYIQWKRGEQNYLHLCQQAVTPPCDSPVLTTQLESNGGGGVMNSVSSRLPVLSLQWDVFLSLVSLYNFHFLLRSRCALKPPPLTVTQHEAGCAGVGRVQVGEQQQWWIAQQQITADDTHILEMMQKFEGLWCLSPRGGAELFVSTENVVRQYFIRCVYCVS